MLGEVVEYMRNPGQSLMSYTVAALEELLFMSASAASMSGN